MPLQFSVLALMVFTTMVAGYFSIACSVGYVEATGALISLVMVTCAFRWRGKGLLTARPRHPWCRWDWGAMDGGRGPVVVPQVCDDCGLYTDILQDRLFGIPIHEIRLEHRTAMSQIAKDLGVPCKHRISRMHKVRWWGFVASGFTLLGEGFVRLGDDDWYDEAMVHIVARARVSPGLGDEFRKRVTLLPMIGRIGGAFAISFNAPSPAALTSRRVRLRWICTAADSLLAW